MKENKEVVRRKKLKSPNEKTYVGFEIIEFGNRKCYKLKYE